MVPPYSSNSLTNSLELTAVRSIRVRTISDSPSSPRAVRRKQDPLPPVPNSPLTPLLSPVVPNSPGKEPIIDSEDNE